jgi:hypothetical protein
LFERHLQFAICNSRFLFSTTNYKSPISTVQL